ncbi:hypothetical protein ONS95_001491 [Cadophora gregata]|uniref:uncharacterized protein n=1 Tax=Cadophora gregata TaxID=51156 RepID=UPI0026DC032B|nr:uncharacterized protein ONS95_001491 [Cadophora gregata]KAK0111114.1 hypothetical protein ONS95_001491 [Cadophora gregata]KAK0112416.1 hypothetical protein ONS96_001660 [Cadophora gregata f. sp. sojae]
MKDIRSMVRVLFLSHSPYHHNNSHLHLAIPAIHSQDNKNNNTSRILNITSFILYSPTLHILQQSKTFKMGLLNSSAVGKESDKAAQILHSFIKKEKLPKAAIANAKGIAIFSAIRGGAMWVSGSGGSGVVLARLPDGSWSGPSSFSVRSGGIGMVYGLDIYDCVCVLNTDEAVEAYSKPELSLGGGVAVTAGPWNAEKHDLKPVWTYTKSKGLYGGLSVDGTAIKERKDANAEFYGKNVTAAQILQGAVDPRAGANAWPAGANQLMEVLKLAEGKVGDKKVIQGISNEPTPGDMDV